MHVDLIDFMGSDDRVVDAARVSFAKEASNFKLGENNKLITYLAKHNHWSPFSHVMVTMRETVPIFVARQRFKHMVGFTYNEVSRRYVDDVPTFFTPDKWRSKAENKKQGSSDEEVKILDWMLQVPTSEHPNPSWVEYPIDYEGFLFIAESFYNHLLERGVAPEQARMVLPQSMYTSYYVTGSLAAWARAYKLRSDEHAQREIQELAVEWNKVISNIAELKHSWSALIGEEKA